MGLDRLGLIIGLRNGVLIGLTGLIIGGVAVSAGLTQSVTAVEIGSAMFALGILEGLLG